MHYSIMKCAFMISDWLYFWFISNMYVSLSEPSLIMGESLLFVFQLLLFTILYMYLATNFLNLCLKNIMYFLLRNLFDCKIIYIRQKINLRQSMNNHISELRNGVSSCNFLKHVHSCLQFNKNLKEHFFKIYELMKLDNPKSFLEYKSNFSTKDMVQWTDGHTFPVVSPLLSFEITRALPFRS